MQTQGNILIVDDDVDTLSLLKVQLKESPFTAYFANSANEGMRLLAEKSIQVVISDLHMPAVDGPHFLYEVRKTFPNTIRLVLSGNTNPSEILDAVNAGHIYSFIQKPWKKESLIIAILNGMDVQKISKERDELLLRSHNLNTKLLNLNSELENKYQQKWHTIEVLNTNISNFLLKNEITKNCLAELLDVILNSRSYVVYSYRRDSKMTLLIESKKYLSVAASIEQKQLKHFENITAVALKELLNLPFEPQSWLLDGLNRVNDFLIVSSEKWNNLDDYLALIRLFLSKVED